MKRKNTVRALFMIPLLMFGFGYLLVPIYNVFCELTGLNGKTGSIEIQHVRKMQVDESRLIKVEFMANRNQNIPIDFAPTMKSMLVHPGKSYQATYRAHNLQEAALIGQAVPSVSPSKAASYFDKTECFCFGRQPFAAGEQRDLPLSFVIHPNLPKDIDTVTLSYTFFDVAENETPDPDHDHDDHDHDHADDAGITPAST